MAPASSSPRQPARPAARRSEAPAPPANPPAKKSALTLRLDPALFRQLALLARAENRSPTNLAETILRREISARDEATRVLTVAAAPELAGTDPGKLLRTEGESADRFARRASVVAELLAIPDRG